MASLREKTNGPHLWNGSSPLRAPPPSRYQSQRAVHGEPDEVRFSPYPSPVLGCL